MRGSAAADDPIRLEHADTTVLEETASSPTVEVRVFMDAELIHRELCEDIDEARAVIDAWSEIQGVTCDVRDIALPAELTVEVEPDGAEGSDADSERQRESAHSENIERYG